MRANHWEHPKYPDVLHSVGTALLQAGMWLEQEAPSAEDRAVLAACAAIKPVDYLFAPGRGMSVADSDRVYRAEIARRETRAVRGEGSQHDLPSRTADADAAIRQPEAAALPFAEVAPLGGGYGADTSEGEP
jgi:hypothetical protein